MYGGRQALVGYHFDSCSWFGQAPPCKAKSHSRTSALIESGSLGNGPAPQARHFSESCKDCSVNRNLQLKAGLESENITTGPGKNNLHSKF